MSDDNNVDVNTDDLDSFSDSFFGNGQPKDGDVPATPEDDPVQVEDNDADTVNSTDEDTVETEETNEEDTEEQDEPEAPVKKKKSVQERINEITTEKYAEKALREKAERELAALKAQLESTPKPVQQELPGRPSPDETLENGEFKYALGEHDPKYHEDLADWRFEQRMSEFQKTEAQRREEQQMEQARNELNRQWASKLVEAEQKYPDFKQKASGLEPLFAGTEAQYAEYLAATIMSLDAGTEVMYYLSNNLDEADAIFRGGPTKATIALGRLEGILLRNSDTGNPKPAVTKAPPPPPQNRGNHGRFEVADDTDDLERFSEKFFRK